MSMFDATTSGRRTITALFDRRDVADRASRDLVAAGVPQDRIRIVEGAATDTGAAVPEEKTFWESLKDLFLPEEDHYAYAEGLRRGGFVLTVQADAGHYENVLDILDRDGAVDMNERETTWRSEGWQSEGWQSGRADDLGETDRLAALEASRGVAAQTTRVAASTTAGREERSERLDAGRDEVVPVTEEQLNVGKRDVSHGKVRLRSYVVETPVNEQVDLRREKVEVTRRPVDRPVGAADATFQDRVIEAEEYAQEAVISKTARVTEEVSLRKTADTEQKTVSDTLRRTEVEVEDNRGGHAVGAAQASSLIIPHMDVITSDGQKVGTVDNIEGQDKIKLAKDTSPDGRHHFIPLAWVDHVDRHVHLNRPRNQVQSGW